MMKTILVKAHSDTLKHYSGVVFYPIDNECNALPEGELQVEIIYNKKRTGKQNNALHKFFAILARVLNDAGLDQRKVLKPDVEIPWSDDAIKENLWRPIQIAVTGKESTAGLETHEVDKVYNVLSRHLSEKLNVDVPFPSARG